MWQFNYIPGNPNPPDPNPLILRDPNPPTPNPPNPNSFLCGSF